MTIQCEVAKTASARTKSERLIGKYANINATYFCVINNAICAFVKNTSIICKSTSLDRDCCKKNPKKTNQVHSLRLLRIFSVFYTCFISPESFSQSLLLFELKMIDCSNVFKKKRKSPPAFAAAEEVQSYSGVAFIISETESGGITFKGLTCEQGTTELL